MTVKFHFWHFAFALLFAVLAALGYLWLATNARLTTRVPLSDFLLMALATMRLIRLFTRDVITEFIRNWFVGADSRTFRGTLDALLSCPWCSGLWFAALVIFFYFATPVAWYAILVLALGAVASSLQIITNYIGWSAEAKKREVLERGL